MGGVQIRWDRGPHPGVDIFPDLSPRAKPYCGVKCSQWLHFPATDCGAWGTWDTKVKLPMEVLHCHKVQLDRFIGYCVG